MWKFLCFCRTGFNKNRKNYNCNFQLQQNYEIIGLSVECYLFKVEKLTIVTYNCKKSWKYWCFCRFGYNQVEKFTIITYKSNKSVKNISISVENNLLKVEKVTIITYNCKKSVKILVYLLNWMYEM